MAYIRKQKYKNKSSYQVIIKRVGFKTLVKSFSLRGDSYKWSRHMERNLSDFVFFRILKNGQVSVAYA